jgi:hypothetical protein|uniref:Uncharacterized protein n=1 Tax=Haptolina ericina TaxID=156174 RepID=A0A7S3AEN9_9EUKA|mmetsp:Transcript_12699/g.28944  ORF Transcript_12699/g.28944 Transcript_12699/m.28944 type:complete len:172 (+) Transcript_12699:339-854(+)
MFLSQWADEYEVGPLKSLCEEHIIKHLPVDGEALRHAITYNLHQRVAQCIRKMKLDPVKYVDELLLLASSSTVEHMRNAWPDICKSAGMDAFEMPDVGQIRCMWPFVSRAIHANSMESALKPKKQKLERLEREMADLPGELYLHLPKAASADVKGRSWMTERVRSLLRSVP